MFGKLSHVTHVFAWGCLATCPGNGITTTEMESSKQTCRLLLIVFCH
jgi:hypothetical protein